jgi:chromosomal replication initiation ATPase DnaA
MLLRPQRVNQIIAEVSSRRGLLSKDVLSDRRDAELVNARREITRLLRARGLSWSAIGRFLRRDHRSIMNLIYPRAQRNKRMDGK